MAPPIVGPRAALMEALKTPSGKFGFGMLGVLVGVVIIIPIIAPYDIVRTWSDAARWVDNPKNAKPEWIDAFSSRKESRMVILDWKDWIVGESNVSNRFKIIILQGRWDVTSDVFPSDFRLQLFANWTKTPPLITVEWTRPKEESGNASSQTLIIFNNVPARNSPADTHFPPPSKFVDVLPLNVDGADSRNRPQTTVQRWAVGLGADPVETSRVSPHVTLHAKRGPEMLDPDRAVILKGRYSLTITAIAFNTTDIVRARFLSYGTAFGLAGTDSTGRDLFIGLVWGAPIALAFGAVAALVTVMTQVVFGALGAFYGGRVDEVIQRLTDWVIILPVLPILILFAQVRTLTIVDVLIIIVVFNLLGGTTKVVRSIALQVKEELFIESARSYGAPRLRILFRYILPRTMPYTFALLALSVPSFIFLEASLSFLGIGDPVLPTWGAIMGDASRNGAAYNGLWWWIALPALGIVFTTVAFAFLGYAFDKVINPRLREA